MRRKGRPKLWRSGIAEPYSSDHATAPSRAASSSTAAASASTPAAAASSAVTLI